MLWGTFVQVETRNTSPLTVCALVSALGCSCLSAPHEPLKGAEPARTLIGPQYETWFTPHNAGSWETAEAVPVPGKYSSYDVNVIKKHEEWFEYLGMDWQGEEAV